MLMYEKYSQQNKYEIALKFFIKGNNKFLI
jgi:hypothetical protein